MPISKNKGPLLTSKIRGTVDNFPKEFLANVGLDILSQHVPLDIEPDDVIGLLIESRTMQERTNERKKTNTYLTQFPETELLSEVFIKETGQTATRRRNLVPDPTDLLTDERTEQANQDNLGNGWLDQTIITNPDLFGATVSGIERTDLVPEIFKAVLPTFIHEETFDGIIDDPPIPDSGDLEKVETQLDIFHKRIRTRGRGDVILPQDKVALRHIGGMPYGGEVTEVDAFLDDTEPIVETGYEIVESGVTNLGDGRFVRQTEKLDVAVEWPEMQGQEYDEGLDVLIPFIEQTIEAGTEIGVSQTDIKPQDQWHSKKRTIDSAAAEAVLGAYLLEYPSKTNINMPDRLVSLSSIMTSGTGDAADDEVGAIDPTNVGNYSINQDMRADATASATAIPEVFAEIKQFYGPNIDCTHYVFFLPNPVVSADVLAKISALLGESIQDWPKFNPKTETFLIVGQNASLKVNAQSKGTYSQSHDLSSHSSTSGGGTGYSRSRGLTIRRMQISPTVHGALSISGTTTTTINLNASCSAEAEGLGPPESIDMTDSVTAHVEPTSLSATDGATDWPTTGKYLYRVDARPYKYGFIMFHTIVVDAANFPNV